MKKDVIVGRPIRLNRQTLKLKKGANYAEVVFLGDIHLGSKQCNVKKLEGMINYCLKNNIYVHLMGDLIEMATRTSVGSGVYEQDFVGQSQYEKIFDYLKPLADKKLILGLHTGNHEERVYKATGVNVSKMLARELKVPYLGDACWNRFKVGNINYNIYTLHGRSGSRFDGTALLALERISTSFFADGVFCGHSHKCINSIVTMQKVENTRVTEHKKHLLITGHYLNYDGGYGQTLGLPISKIGSPKVKFYANKKDILISW